MQDFKNLKVWEKSHQVAIILCRLTRGFPREEIYGLTAQIKRAAVSIPSNIAEGQGRWTTGEFVQFLGVAHGSLCEVETQIHVALRLRLIQQADADPVFRLASEVGRLIYGLKNSLV